MPRERDRDGEWVLSDAIRWQEHWGRTGISWPTDGRCYAKTSGLYLMLDQIFYIDHVHHHQYQRHGLSLNDRFSLAVYSWQRNLRRRSQPKTIERFNSAAERKIAECKWQMKESSRHDDIAWATSRAERERWKKNKDVTCHHSTWNCRCHPFLFFSMVSSASAKAKLKKREEKRQDLSHYKTTSSRSFSYRCRNHHRGQ